MFYFDEINGKRILKSDFIKHAQAFFTTRDICIKSKEHEMAEITAENRNLISKYLGISPDNFISPSQTHTANIELTHLNRKDYPDTDALILTDYDAGIFLNFADCTPVIIYDTNQNIGAIAHAGWKGTAQNITTKTAEKLINGYNSNPKDIVGVIGPAIGFCCYNVGEEVLEALKRTVKNFDGLSGVFDGKIYVDLKNINKRQLQEVGVEKIDVCPYCTVHNNDIFYSYRKENGTTNRHSAVLRLE